MNETNKDKISIIIEKLKNIGILKYGEFTLKSGISSNYYCDFRTLISYPNLLKSIYKLIPNSMFEDVDIVCGVFFGGMPLANLISFKRQIPQIFIRDNEKNHGTKRQIEGNYKKGQTVLLIEDVITSGQSITEKIKILENCGLNIKILTILKRNEELNEICNYRINSILPLNKIINGCENELSKLYKLAFKKTSNIILSVDLNNSSEIIELIEETKENIIGIKIHSDIIEDFHLLVEYLRKTREDFIIIEDCKVADISFISIQKVKKYVEYADYITYHCLLGDELPISLKNEYEELGLLGVVEMSVKNSLIDEDYIKNVEKQLELMDGCIIQNKGMNTFKNILPITFSPGISISSKKDEHNQQYRMPLNKNNCNVKEKFGEFLIVGRGIYLEKNRKEMSEKYRELGWSHFMNFL